MGLEIDIAGMKILAVSKQLKIIHHAVGSLVQKDSRVSPDPTPVQLLTYPHITRGHEKKGIKQEIHIC